MARVMPESPPQWSAAAGRKRFEGLLVPHAVGVAIFEEATVYVLQTNYGHTIVFPWELDEHLDKWLAFYCDSDGLVHMVDTAVDYYLLGCET